jgi:hypothetical protein
MAVDAELKTASTPERPGARRRGYYVEIFLVSFAGLLLEISYTRVISAKLFYYYTYLVIGLALLGIGAGGVAVAISRRLRRAPTDTVMLWSLVAGAVSVGVGYVVVAFVELDTFGIWKYGTWDSVANLGLLLVICLALCSSFIAIGIVISTLFSRAPDRIGRLYFSDLLGAGLACALVVALITMVGPPGSIFLAGLLFAIGALRIVARTRPRLVPAVGVLALVLAVGVVAPGSLPEQRLEATKLDVINVPIRYSAWSPIFRVDVIDEIKGLRTLYHDGLVGSSIYRWDGKESSLASFHFDSDPRALAFAPDERTPGNVMIIGAAGGHEILTSLYYKARHIDAIELNPVTYELVTDRFADFNGHIAERPNVNYVNGDGRSFLARSDKQYDLVWYPAPDSYSATNAASAGAFVLSESYLYTSNAIKDSFDHLRPDGIVAAQFGEVNYGAKPNRTTRYVGTARHALAQVGVRDPSRHILVATSPTELGAGSVATILVKPKPFTAAEVERFARVVKAVPGAVLRYAPDRAKANSPVTRVITSSPAALDRFYDGYRYDVRPISDDRPFFWHFKPFGNVISNFEDKIDTADREDTVGERVLLLLLFVAILLAAVFLLLPFLAIRRIWAGLPRKGASAVYFGALGLGFLLFEITLIQRLVLFLGYPTYSLTVTLASILLFTGVGAFLSGRRALDARRMLPLLFVTLVGLTAFYLFGLGPVTDGLLSQPLAARVIIAFVLLAPLGLCLGIFMPLGLGAVAQLTRHPREYVAWGWAVNGFASVIGSVLTTMLAMTFGFRVVLVCALLTYTVALIALRTLLGPRGRVA